MTKKISFTILVNKVKVDPRAKIKVISDSQLLQLLYPADNYCLRFLVREGSSLSRGPERKSLLAIRANHITIGTRDASEKTKPIVPAVGGTKANTPADNPA